MWCAGSAGVTGVVPVTPVHLALPAHGERQRRRVPARVRRVDRFGGIWEARQGSLAGPVKGVAALSIRVRGPQKTVRRERLVGRQGEQLLR